MFLPKPDPDDEPEPVGPDDEREWRTEADLIRRTNAELLRVKRAMHTFAAMEKVWETIKAGWQSDRNRFKWVDEHTGEPIA